MSEGRLSQQLESIVGAPHVVTDAGERAYFSADLSMIPGEVAEWVVQPGSAEEVAAIVRVATEAGAPIVPRGGGMSYTQTYVPSRPGSVLLDMRRMNRILDVSAEDLLVVAEAGATWEDVYLAVSEQGARTPYWGPLSGRYATVGGTLSNNSVFFGSTRYGSVAESVLGLEVVLASGETIRTSSWAQRNGSPFSRYYGPDLTGLFLGDTGAMAVKTKAALRLIPLPAVSLGLAFELPSIEASNACLIEMGRTELAAEAYGFDPLYNGVFANLGFSFLENVAWSLFAVVDAPDEATGEAAANHLRAIGLRHGKEIDASVPMAVRADPFGAVPQVLMGPQGQVWLPLHGLFPASRAKAVTDATMKFLADHAETIERHDIKTSFLTLATGKDYLLEPSFYWHDALSRFQLERIDPANAEAWGRIPEDPAAREDGLRLRRELAELFDAHGAVHLQIGKWYEFGRWIEPETRNTLRALKLALDPKGLVNPGSLGLGE